ncbi:MAG: galactose-1-phosphate uridylyltransferase [Carbonactinosporaceae bacterium]
MSTGRGAGQETRVRLADGREIIYFDDTPGHHRTARDERVLEACRPRSEIRYDPVLDEWVIIAAHRQVRTNLPATGECPLCPSRAGRPSEIPAQDYHVVAFENRFPSLAAHHEPGSGEGPAGTTRPATGRCEVVCFTSDHHGSFADLPPSRLGTVARAWVHRTLELSRLPGVEYVFVFENRGPEIGATLQHPHGQIYAYPFVPPRTARALESARRWRAAHGGCLCCVLVADESREGTRVIAETDDFVAFVPAAARWPYEVYLYPRRHVPDLPALSEGEIGRAMLLYAEVLRRFDALFGRPLPYVASWHQAPVRVDRDLAHLSLQIFTPRRASHRLKYLAASESGVGAFVNDVLPEDAAARLRGSTGADGHQPSRS